MTSFNCLVNFSEMRSHLHFLIEKLTVEFLNTSSIEVSGLIDCKTRTISPTVHMMSKFTTWRLVVDVRSESYRETTDCDAVC